MNELNEAAEAASSELRACVACCDNFPPTWVSTLRCKCFYCGLCIEKLFEASLREETRFPPACHQVPITLKIARSRLTQATLRAYEARFRELSTRNKVYCHRPRCSAFIATHSVHNGAAHCQRCHSVTCFSCRNAWHYGQCTPEKDAGLFELMRTCNWRKCPGCQRVVERHHGCAHMTFVSSLSRTLYIS